MNLILGGIFLGSTWMGVSTGLYFVWGKLSYILTLYMPTKTGNFKKKLRYSSLQFLMCFFDNDKAIMFSAHYFNMAHWCKNSNIYRLILKKKFQFSYICMYIVAYIENSNIRNFHPLLNQIAFCSNISVSKICNTYYMLTKETNDHSIELK